MWNELRASWALLIGIGFMMLGNGLQSTLLGLRATMEGFPTFTTGIMMSGYFIGIFVGSMIAPKLVQRVGHIRVFAALASLASISILVHGIYVSAITWSIMRLITGISYAGLFVVSESWLNDRASNETRGQMLSVYMVVITIGLGGGQFLLNLGSPANVDLFVLVSIIVSIGLIPILLTARPAPAFALTGKMSLAELYRASPLAVISNGLTGIAQGTVFGLGAVYARQELYDVKLISIFMASFLLGSLIFQWPIGWISDRVSRRVVMIGMSVMAIAACIAAMLLPKSGPLFFAVIVILGGAVMPMYSLSIAYANDRLKPEQIVPASGGLVMVAGMGLSAGPIIVSFLMGKFGSMFYFIGIASAFALLMVFAVYRMTVTKRVAPSDRKSIVVAGLIGTPVAEYNAHDAEDYVESIICGESGNLYEQSESNESATERKL
ncbi:MFS transporter [Candidatus Spongiihabitans sp.]|uniref:MFS transporter n=1 Tax=Candidatus Spongiihabitans sp. TaxID=3101308 RepID=UPI003C6FB9A9